LVFALISVLLRQSARAHLSFSISHTLHLTVSNFNVRDLGTIAGTTVLSAPVGHLIGARLKEEKEKERKRRINRRLVSSSSSSSSSSFFSTSSSSDLPLPSQLPSSLQQPNDQTGLKNKTPRPAMWAAAVIGGTAGFLLSYQSSAARLMGFAPNDKEVEKGLRGKR